MGSQDVGSGILPEKVVKPGTLTRRTRGSSLEHHSLCTDTFVLSASAGLPQDAPQVHHNQKVHH